MHPRLETNSGQPFFGIMVSIPYPLQTNNFSLDTVSLSCFVSELEKPSLPGHESRTFSRDCGVYVIFYRVQLPRYRGCPCHVMRWGDTVNPPEQCFSNCGPRTTVGPGRSAGRSVAKLYHTEAIQNTSRNFCI
jgi:hypothetical protein